MSQKNALYPKTADAIEALVRAARLAAEAAAEEDAPGSLQASLRSEAERVSYEGFDLAYQARTGRLPYCRCPGHDGRFDLHEAARQVEVERQRRLDAEREARRRAAGETPEAAAGWR